MCVCSNKLGYTYTCTETVLYFTSFLWFCMVLDGIGRLLTVSKGSFRTMNNTMNYIRYIYFYITCRDIILYDKFNSYGLNIFKHIRNDNVLIFCYVKFILSLTKVRWFYLNFQAGKTFNISLSCFIFIFIWTL